VGVTAKARAVAAATLRRTSRMRSSLNSTVTAAAPSTADSRLVRHAGLPNGTTWCQAWMSATQRGSPVAWGTPPVTLMYCHLATSPL
jgi:hypothetical protein